MIKIKIKARKVKSILKTLKDITKQHISFAEEIANLQKEFNAIYKNKK